MKDFYTDIFTYHHEENQKIIEQILEHKTTDKIQLLMSHSINAHQIWNSRIKGEQVTILPYQIMPTSTCSTSDLTNYTNTMEIIQTQDLSRTIHYSNTKGDIFQNTIQQILFHVSNHFSHH